MVGRDGDRGPLVEVPVSFQVKCSTARVRRHGCVLVAAPKTRARLNIRSNTYCGVCSCDRPKTVRQPGRKIWRLTNQRGSDRPRSLSERERSGLLAVRLHRWTGAVMCAGVSYNRILTVWGPNAATAWPAFKTRGGDASHVLLPMISAKTRRCTTAARASGRAALCRVASLRCTHPLRVSFQYSYRKDDSIVLVSICGRLMRSTFQYISKLIPTVSPGDLHTSSPAMARAYGGAAGNARQPFRGGGGELQAMPGSRFAGTGGAADNARQPFRGGRRHWLCRQSALWLEPIFNYST